MKVTSAGLLVNRRTGQGTDVLLGHPGGPLWARKDLGAWTVPKGLVETAEEPLQAAPREFGEGTGLQPPAVIRLPAPIRPASGKTVPCWAAAGDLERLLFAAEIFVTEWPPRSGKRAVFPELDRLPSFGREEALARLPPSQAGPIHQAPLTSGEDA